jgi:hypothetical protein
MTIQRRAFTSVAGHLLAAASLVGGSAACSHGESSPPAQAASPTMAQPTANAAPGSAVPSNRAATSTPPRPAPQGGGGERDAELVVSHEIVARCPTLRLVKAHVEEFDPNTVWLAVLESIGECMGEGGPMASQSIGVSGDEEHRHVVREVLGSRGVAPTRVIAAPPSEGAAECQGGADCGKRVELTIISQ